MKLIYIFLALLLFYGCERQNNFNRFLKQGNENVDNAKRCLRESKQDSALIYEGKAIMCLEATEYFK